MTRVEWGERVSTVMDGLLEEVASKKLISILFFFSIGHAARKTLLDKYPATQIATIALLVPLDQCEQSFVVKRDRTPDRLCFFFSRKQGNKDSFQQFWNPLNGLAAKCELEGQTNSLIYDIFILIMNNEVLQERLRAEPKGIPEEAFQFAVAFGQGIKPQFSHGDCKLHIKSQPILYARYSILIKFILAAALITSHRSISPNAGK